MRRARGLVAALAAAGCGARPAVPPVRFANAPAVTAVDDRRDVPTPPAVRRFHHDHYHFEGLVYRRVARALELRGPRRARGVNALDEVPDSTWFTNRIGVRELSLDELRRGPATIESPERHKPWTIVSTKAGGSEPGFVVTDTRGERFLLKFDRPGFPEVATAAQMITARLMWAIGYSVSEDFLVDLEPDDLVVAAGAVIKGPLGEAPLTRDEVLRRLARLDHAAGGRHRALASRWIAGTLLGGPPSEGVRADDPNDLIPHELRRDLRGAYPICAWLDHVDVHEGNFVDAWIADPRDPHRHYVVHHWIDFNRALGAMAWLHGDPRRGHQYAVDVAGILGRLLTFGLAEGAWEGYRVPGLRGVALFAAGAYDPGGWRPSSPAYVPLLVADDIDKFWGAKLLMRFSRDQLRAVVDTARLSDPRAAAYLTDVLVARQRATGRHWFGRVNPLDRFAIGADGRLCFDDLLIRYQLADDAPATTRYSVTSHARAGRGVGAPVAARAGPAGRACAGPVALASGDGYTILRVHTRRAGFAGDTYVHVARAPDTGMPRVIGLWRP